MVNELNVHSFLQIFHGFAEHTFIREFEKIFFKLVFGNYSLAGIKIDVGF